MHNLTYTKLNIFISVFSLLLMGSHAAFAQAADDPWTNSQAVKIARGEKSIDSTTIPQKSQQPQNFNASQSPYSENSNSDRNRRYFFEISPTYLHSEVTFSERLESYSYDAKIARDYFGVTTAFGWQINSWNKLQFDFGILYSNERKDKITQWGIAGNSSFSDNNSDYQFLFPTLLTYNACIPLGSPNISLCAGPSIGGVEMITHSDDTNKGSDYNVAFAAGGNISVNIAVSQRFYVQLTVRYLYMSKSGDFESDEKMNTYSGMLSCGWRF